MGGAKISTSGAETSVSLEENGFGAIPRSKQPFAWDEERFWTTFAQKNQFSKQPFAWDEERF